MIDKLKTIRYTLRDTEKYLFGIIKNEWMKDHPHIMYNDKQILSDIIANLIKTSEELKVIIDSINIELNKEEE
tara:strand:- start:1228 stop:1446 length:219 start_codon:yes stop_codon:yes gene_type:complete